MDCEAGDFLLDARDTAWANMLAAATSKACARPWMGLHSIDIVRRDAAERQVPFQTTLTPDGKEVQVDDGPRPDEARLLDQT